MKNLVKAIIPFLASCMIMDSINFTQLVNNTGENIKVSVYYDKDLLDSQMISYKHFIEARSERGRAFLVGLDTDSIAVTYLVPKDKIFIFDKENGPEPDLKSIKYIIIQSAGRFNKYEQSEILRSMKRKGKGYWEWNVK